MRKIWFLATITALSSGTDSAKVEDTAVAYQSLLDMGVKAYKYERSFPGNSTVKVDICQQQVSIL